MSRSRGAEEVYGEQAKTRGSLGPLVLASVLLLLVACSGSRTASRVFDSPEGAQELVSFSVLVPTSETLPTGVGLEEVRWKHDREKNAEMVDLVYQGSGMELSTEQYARQEVRLGAPNEPHERVAVRGTTGYLYSQPTGGAHSMAWEENGTIVSVSTSGMTLEQTLRIVEGMRPVGK